MVEMLWKQLIKKFGGWRGAFSFQQRYLFSILLPLKTYFAFTGVALCLQKENSRFIILLFATTVDIISVRGGGGHMIPETI